MSKFISETSEASHPAHLVWSDAKLRALRPDLFGVSGAFYSAFVLLGKQFNDKQFIKECIDGGDSRAAVVIAVAPLLVAAYTDEFDAVVLLRFPDHFVQQYRLAVGTRLLTVNCYGAEAHPPDIIPAPGAVSSWDNVIPTIAEFASDDLQQIERLKREIPEAEWRRAFQLGQQYLQQLPGVYRDGRPFFSAMPLQGAREYEAELTRAQNARITWIGGLGGGLILMLLMCGGVGTMVAFLGRKPPNGQVAQAPPAEPLNKPPRNVAPPAPRFPPPAPFAPPPAFMPVNPGGFPPLVDTPPVNSPPPVNENQIPAAAVNTAIGPPGPPVTPVASVEQEPAPAPAGDQPVAPPSAGSEPVPPAEEPLAEEPQSGTFRRGQQVFAEWAGKWEPVEILEVLPGGKYKIRWKNWGPQWDEVRAGDRLAAKVPGGATPAARGGSREGPGTAIDDSTPLAAGDKVHAYWLGQWVMTEVVATPGRGIVTVRLTPIPGAPPQEVPLPRRSIRLPERAAERAVSKPPADMRTWTDSSGKFQIEAKFVAFTDGQVTLEKPDGTPIRMPLDKLSAADQKFVTEQALQP